MKCSGMFYSLETNQNEIMMSSTLGWNQIAFCIGKHGTFTYSPNYAWFALKRLGISSGAVLVYFPGSKTKDVVMFFSLETNQIKEMKSRSR